MFDVEDEPVLDGIKADHPGDANKCAAEMLRLWLNRKPDASWNQLIQAFRASKIKLEALASKIEEMLSKGMWYLASYLKINDVLIIASSCKITNANYKRLINAL